MRALKFRVKQSKDPADYNSSVPCTLSAAGHYWATSPDSNFCVASYQRPVSWSKEYHRRLDLAADMQILEGTIMTFGFRFTSSDNPLISLRKPMTENGTASARGST